MERTAGLFDDFSIEIEEYEVKKTGRFDRIWNVTEGGSMAQLPLVYDGKLYFGSFNHNVYCLDAASGKLNWKFKAHDRVGVASPTAGDGMIYIGSYDQNMYALGSGTGEMQWRFRTMGKITTCAVVVDGVLCFGSCDKNFYGLDASTGMLLWKFRTMGRITSDPTVYGGLVLFGSCDKNFYCVDMKTGALVWKYRTEDEIVNSGKFAINDGCIYLTSMDNNVHKLRLSDGLLVWKKRMASYGLCCSTTTDGAHIFVPSDDGNLFKIDFNGNVLWKFSTTKPLGVAAIHMDSLYFTSEDMNLYCLSKSGELRWKFKAQELNWWGVAGSGDLVFFCSYDCHMYALDARTGRLVWKFRTVGSPSYIPPHNDMYEAVVKIPETEAVAVIEKKYDMPISDDSGGSVTYKSRITYQLSTQYSSRGKYRIDSF